jgi:hypothetical protein
MSPEQTRKSEKATGLLAFFKFARAGIFGMTALGAAPVAAVEGERHDSILHPVARDCPTKSLFLAKSLKIFWR